MQIHGGHIISYIVAVGAFAVAALAIYLGYDLFLRGATGEFKLLAGFFSLVSVAPGLGFAAFGAAIAWRALGVLIGKSN